MGLNGHPAGLPETRQLAGPPGGPTQNWKLVGKVTVKQADPGPAAQLSAAMPEALMLFT